MSSSIYDSLQVQSHFKTSIESYSWILILICLQIIKVQLNKTQGNKLLDKSIFEISMIRSLIKLQRLLLSKKETSTWDKSDKAFSLNLRILRKVNKPLKLQNRLKESKYSLKRRNMKELMRFETYNLNHLNICKIK